MLIRVCIVTAALEGEGEEEEEEDKIACKGERERKNSHVWRTWHNGRVPE